MRTFSPAHAAVAPRARCCPADRGPAAVRATFTVFAQKLAAEGAAYQTEDGSWYFRLAAFPEYGKLRKKDLSGMEDGARVATCR